MILRITSDDYSVVSFISISDITFHEDGSLSYIPTASYGNEYLFPEVNVSKTQRRGWRHIVLDDSGSVLPRGGGRE